MLFVIVGLLAVLVLSAQVGGVMMRNNVVRGEYLELGVLEPVVPGVPVTVRWEKIDSMPAAEVKLWWRTTKQEEQIGTGNLENNSAQAVWPCDNQAQQGTLEIADAESGQVFGYQEITVQAAGPECLP